jgi:hypothetical protein
LAAASIAANGGSSLNPTFDSSFSPARRAPLGDRTIESLQLESEAIALQEATEHCAQLRREQGQLALGLRRFQTEHHRLSTDFRSRAGILRSQVSKEDKRLGRMRFIQTRKYEHCINFSHSPRIVSALASILQYSPLAEFAATASTAYFDSPVAPSLTEFIEAAKNCSDAFSSFHLTGMMKTFTSDLKVHAPAALFKEYYCADNDERPGRCPCAERALQPWVVAPY